MIRELIKAQVHDPGKGSFMVHPRPVSKGNGNVKLHLCKDGVKRPVYRAPYFQAKSGSYASRDDAMDYVVIGDSVSY